MTNKALTRAAFGARGTGKTAWVRQTIERERPPRLIVWDFKHDPGLEGIGHPVYTVAELARLAKGATFRLRFMVDHTQDVHAQFKLFCLVCWIAGNLLMFVDELPEVTQAGRAPPEWRRCVNVGRDYVHEGRRQWLAIIAAGQRLAETDKSFIANLDVLHVGRLGNLADCREVASLFIGVRPEDVASLPDLHFIEKRADKAGTLRGVLSFGVAKKPAAKKKPRKATSGKPPPKGTPLRESVLQKPEVEVK